MSSAQPELVIPDDLKAQYENCQKYHRVLGGTRAEWWNTSILIERIATLTAQNESLKQERDLAMERIDKYVEQGHAINEDKEIFKAKNQRLVERVKELEGVVREYPWPPYKEFDIGDPAQTKYMGCAACGNTHMHRTNPPCPVAAFESLRTALKSGEQEKEKHV